MRVVDLFEVVNIGEQHCDGFASAQRPGDLRVRLALPCCGIEQSGLRVRAGRGRQLSVHEAALEQHDWREGHEQQQWTERAGDGDQYPHADLGQVQHHALTVPELVGQSPIRLSQSGGYRDQTGVQHAERQCAGHADGHLMRSQEVPAIRAQPLVQHRRHGARQAEGGRAEDSPVDRGTPDPQVQDDPEDGGCHHRIGGRQQQRHREPPRGQQVTGDSGRLPKAPSRLDAQRPACHERGEQRHVRGMRPHPGQFPACQGRVHGNN